MIVRYIRGSYPVQKKAMAKEVLFPKKSGLYKQFPFEVLHITKNDPEPFLNNK
jgi:hypothetical protein